MIGAHDLTNRANITYRQLDYWCRTNRLHATNERDATNGVPRVFPDTEITVARLMGQLLAAGLNLQPAHDAARQLITDGHADLGAFQLTSKENSPA